jgi:hypothetical protein
MAAIRKQEEVFKELKEKEKVGYVLVRVKGSGDDWFKVIDNSVYVVHSLANMPTIQRLTRVRSCYPLII